LGCLIAEIIIGPFGLSLISEIEVMMLFFLPWQQAASIVLNTLFCNG